MITGRTRRPQGYATWVGPDQPIRERDTLTCGHCGSLVVVDPAPALPPGGFCRGCMRAICDACLADPSCRPLEARITASEEADARRRHWARLGI